MSVVIQETIRGSHLSVCRTEDLEPGWGEAAWLDGAQLALYRTENENYFASSHHCPTSGAKVMARGILGDTTIEGQSVATIACPLHKEIFRLDTGDCLNGTGDRLPVFDVLEHQGQLWVGEIR